MPAIATTQARIKIKNVTTGLEEASDANFTIRLASSITVTSPNGGEVFTHGQQIDVTWAMENVLSTDVLQINYTTGVVESNVYSLVSSYFSNYPENTFTWTIPGDYATDARIEVKNVTTGVSDKSDATFSMLPATSLTVTSPNGGESFAAGSEVNITWSKQTTEDSDALEISYSLDEGISYDNVLVTSTFGEYLNNSFAWTLPNMGTTKARVRVRNLTKDLSDESNNNFQIRLPSTITVTSPNGGETLVVGEQYNITWLAENALGTDALRIRYNTNGGNNNYTILNSTFANYTENTFTWAVPGDVSTDARIEVANLTTGATDQSDAIFTIVPATSLTVTSPNGGEPLAAGSQVNITWSKQSTANTDGLKISYSTDGGATYENTILTSTFGVYPTNSYSWTVPSIRNNQVRIKVENTTKGLSDVSNANFQIGDYTAPGFVETPKASIVGKKHSITVEMNEVSTVYYAIFPNNQFFTNAQLIAAIKNDETLTGQLMSGKSVVTDINNKVQVDGTANYVDLSYYKIIITAEDAAGNINQAYNNVSIQAQYTPLQKDSVVLRTIYNQMGGADWVNISKDWTTNPITDWAEIKITNGRVTEVDLSEKGLIGDMPQTANQLNALTSLKLTNNNIKSVPSFAQVSSLSTLDVKNNKLLFSSIVPNKDVDGFAFDPQQPLFTEVYDTIQAGANKILDSDYQGVGAVYQWSFGSLIPGKPYNDNGTPIAGGTGQNYTITNIRANNQGTYTLSVTHPSIPDFTLKGERQNIYGKTDLFGAVRANGAAVTKGDVFIYRQTPEGPFVKEDSTVLIAEGNYALKDIVLGDFIVQVKPDRSVDSTALQTYYESADRFIEADTLFLNAQVEGIDIDLLFYNPRPIAPKGARIGGRLTQDVPDVDGRDGYRTTARRKVRKAACSMRKFKSTGRGLENIADTEIAYYIETDDEGYFNFEGVEDGRYLLNIEFPGVPMDPNSVIEFIVDSETKLNQAFTVDALITETGIMVDQTEEFDLPLSVKQSFLKDVLMYPNPTQGVLGVDYTVSKNIQDLKVSIINIEGRRVFEQKVAHRQGRHHTSVDMTNYGSGIYLMIFTDSSSSFIEQYRVVRK